MKAVIYRESESGVNVSFIIALVFLSACVGEKSSKQKAKSGEAKVFCFRIFSA